MAKYLAFQKQDYLRCLCVRGKIVSDSVVVVEVPQALIEPVSQVSQSKVSANECTSLGTCRELVQGLNDEKSRGGKKIFLGTRAVTKPI